MRKATPDRTQVVPVDGVETLIDCTITVKTNVPIDVFIDAEADTVISTIDFLEKTLVAWSGFDMELSRESLRSLQLPEAKRLVKLVSDTIVNPLVPTSDASQ